MDLAAIEAERARLHAEYINDDRPPSSARGIHHTALLSSDVERTIRFYQEILEFPLTEIIENRDYQGSNHFFFDVGNGNLLAFFDFPGLDLGPYAEVLGGLHHLAISVTPEKWAHLRGKLDAAERPLPGGKRHVAVLPRPRRRPPGTPRRPPGRDVRQPRPVARPQCQPGHTTRRAWRAPVRIGHAICP